MLRLILFVCLVVVLKLPFWGYFWFMFYVLIFWCVDERYKCQTNNASCCIIQFKTCCVVERFWFLSSGFCIWLDPFISISFFLLWLSEFWIFSVRLYPCVSVNFFLSLYHQRHWYFSFMIKVSNFILVWPMLYAVRFGCFLFVTCPSPLSVVCKLVPRGCLCSSYGIVVQKVLQVL